MSLSFLTAMTEEEFKNFLKQAITEVMKNLTINDTDLSSDPLDVEQAAKFLKIQITTLYEKTCHKTIPHFKKGNKLYFHKSDLLEWVKQGKVSTKNDLEIQAQTYLMKKH